jgi:hypothetical protein
MKNNQEAVELTEAQAAELRATLQQALASGGAALRAQTVVDVAANTADWIDSGLDLREGEQVSLLAAGKVWLSRELGVGFGAKVALWHRIGSDGPIAKSIGDTSTFKAARSGRLMLVAKPPGEFLNPTGAFDPAYPRGGASGLLVVAVAAWSGGAPQGLAAIAAADTSGLAQREHSRLAAPVHTPPGWHHLWRLGEGEVYSQAAARGNEPAQLCCRTAQDVGILQYPVDVALDESTRLSWAWRVTQLPSAVAENTLHTHDYLSIAVEFDNGQDLTYLWSSELPVGTAFRCPLPWWDRIETHQVVRSGSADLGRWLDQSQTILADYRKAVGGTEPRRIVAVWLIAVSLFQGSQGSCDYARIRLESRGNTVTVRPA